MVDKGEPGINNDVLSITIWGSNNALLYSSNWAGGASVEVPINGGNIQVNSTSSVVQNGINMNSVEENVPARDAIFDFKVFPNPSKAAFNVKIESDSKEPMYLTVRDVLGRVIESVKVYSGQNVRFGEAYTPGSYFAEIIQGKKKKMIKLIRQSN